MSGESIIYADQTSVSLWMVEKLRLSCWQSVHDRIFIGQSDSFASNQCVYGAVGECLIDAAAISL